MRIIKANTGAFIKPEHDNIPPIADNHVWTIYGYRWNRNKQAWGQFCILFIFGSYEWVTEAELPKNFTMCNHNWKTTDNWLIDKCSICGEERA